MTGWRIGFAVGNQEAVNGLGGIKSNVDSGAFQAVQIAGMEALKGNQSCVREMTEVYGRRRDVMVQGLRQTSFKVEPPKATFYLWIRIPEGHTSAEVATKLLEEGVVVTPGNGFGDPGEGYIRMALTQKEDRLKEAIKRIKAIKF